VKNTLSLLAELAGIARILRARVFNNVKSLAFFQNSRTHSPGSAEDAKYFSISKSMLHFSTIRFLKKFEFKN